MNTRYFKDKFNFKILTKLANHETNNFDKHFDCHNNQNFNKNKYLWAKYWYKNNNVN